MNKQYAINKHLLLADARNGISIFDNQINYINNLKVNREIKFTLKDIFYNYWAFFVARCNAKGKKIRPAILEAVDKMINCKDISNGYLFFECPNCNNFHIQGFSCNSRFCPSCGNRYREARTIEISKVCLNKPHRQFVFSIAKELRPYFLFHRELYDILFKSVEEAFDYILKSSKIAKAQKRDFGYISFLHTFGRAINDNPHIHVLICDGYMDKDNSFHNYNHFHYELLRKSFMKILLDKIYSFLKTNHKDETKKFYKLKCFLYNKYKDGFYAYGPKIDCATKIGIKSLTKYVGRYISHPAIAESRITNINYIDKTVTYFYEPHQDEHTDDPNLKLGTQVVTESVFDFMAKLIRHIPDKGFHLIRYYGFYSNRTTKSLDNEKPLYSSTEIDKMKRDNYWINHLISSYNYSPLICICGAIMIFNYELSYFPGGAKDG